MNTPRQAFRALLRVQKQAFANDVQMIASARETTRTEFRKKENLTSPEDLNMKMKAAQEALEFIKGHIVQVKLNERGNYEIDAAKANEEVLPEEAK